MNEQALAVIAKSKSMIAGYTKMKGGTRGYALKVNNMTRKAIEQLVDLGVDRKDAESACWKAQSEAQLRRV